MIAPLQSLGSTIIFRLLVEEMVVRLGVAADIGRRTNERCTALVDLDQRVPASGSEAISLAPGRGNSDRPGDFVALAGAPDFNWGVR